MLASALATVLLLAASAVTFDTAYRAGLAALNRNEFAMAQFQLEAAAKLQPNNGQVWLALAQTYFKQGRMELADGAAVKAATAGASQPTVLHALAFFYAETHRPAKAATFEAQYAAKNLGDEDAFSRAIDLYLSAREPREAVTVGQKAIELEDGVPAVHLALAKAYVSAGQFEKAVPEYKRAIELRPFDESSYLILGQALVERRRFAEAVDVLAPARERFDKSAQISFAAATAFQGLGRFPEAADALLHTIELAPELSQPYLQLGKMLDKVGARMPEVAGALGSYASAKPNDYMSSFLYAQALAAQHADPAQYVPLLRKSIEANPKYWEAHFQLGEALEQENKLDEAAAEYRKSAALNPGEAKVRERLGHLGKATLGNSKTARP